MRTALNVPIKVGGEHQIGVAGAEGFLRDHFN